MEVRRNGEGKAYQRQEGGDGVHDEDRRQRVSGRRGQRKLVVGGTNKTAVYNSIVSSNASSQRSGFPGAGSASYLATRTGAVADHGPMAVTAIAVS